MTASVEMRCTCGAVIEAVIDSPPGPGKFWQRVGTCEVVVYDHWHEPAAVPESAIEPEPPMKCKWCHKPRYRHTPMNGKWYCYGKSVTIGSEYEPAASSAIEVAPQADIRGLAVELVDGIHGYTMEYAPDPRQHRALYDWAEEKLHAALEGSKS
jgi:hypothetical protein